MARRNIRCWVVTSMAFGLLTSCFVPKYGEFASDAGASGSANTGGVTSVGGSSSAGGLSTVGGNTSLGGASNGPSGGAAASGATSVGGTAPSIGGTNGTGGTTAGVDTTTTGGAATGGNGTTSAGGTSATGGFSSGGSSSSAGGFTSTGGLSNTGGIKPTGGSSSASSTATGGTATGGTSTGTGGTITGGSPGTGGTAGAAGSSGVPVPTYVSAGGWHTCALMSDGTVRCWGLNCSGRLGDGNAAVNCTSTPYPYSWGAIQVQNLTQATAVSSGGYHTCALVTGRVACWGMNKWGQLGVAPNTGTYGTSANSSSSPVWAAGITNATSIVTGDQHTCAILSDTSVKCWGLNGSGELGANSSDSSNYIPAAVVVDTANTKLTGVTQLATSYNHTCALVSSTHQVYCWGNNYYGQLGIPYATASESNVAVKATALLNSIGSLTVSAISAGEYFTCALLSEKSVRCWGQGTSGELGNTLAQDSEAPVTVALSTTTPRATAVGSGYGHSCAVLDITAQTAQCWGANGYGQIGNGSNTDTPTPADVLTDTATPLTGAGQISVGGDHTCALASGGFYCWGNNGYGQLGRNDMTMSTTAVRVLGL